VCVKSPFLEPGENPLGIVLVVRRPDVMGPSAEPPHVLPQIGRIRDRSKLRLPLPLGPAGARRVANERSLVGTKCKAWKNQVEDQQHGGEASHAIPFLSRSGNYSVRRTELYQIAVACHRGPRAFSSRTLRQFSAFFAVKGFLPQSTQRKSRRDRKEEPGVIESERTALAYRQLTIHCTAPYPVR